MKRPSFLNVPGKVEEKHVKIGAVEVGKKTPLQIAKDVSDMLRSGLHITPMDRFFFHGDDGLMFGLMHVQIIHIVENW